MITEIIFVMIISLHPHLSIFFFFSFLPSKRGSGSGDMRTCRSDWIRIYNNTFSPLNTLQGTNCFSNQDNTVDKMTILFLFTKWVLQKIVVHLTLRSYGVNQTIRFVEGIWLHRKSRQIRLFFSEQGYFTSYVRNILWIKLPYFTSFPCLPNGFYGILLLILLCDCARME